MIGGSIIIPIAIRVEATTMSMTRKGMNSRNPMVKAVFNSLMTKEGTRTRVGTSSRLRGRGDYESFTNRARSFSLVWANMNLRTGNWARSSAWVYEIRPSI